MHYSIPLFIDGQGLWTKEDPARHRDAATAAQPVLNWHLERDGEKRWLVVTNRGQVHARVTEIAFETQGGAHLDVERGLLGYALPGAQMRWQLSKKLALSEQSRLIATVNGRTGVVIDADVAGAHH
jgi:fimbrial chaperone protein